MSIGIISFYRAQIQAIENDFWDSNDRYCRELSRRERVVEAIAVQRENAAQRIGENERIEFLVVDWASARRVGISTGRKDIP